MSMKTLQPATKANPCPHCGKEDWCYIIGELSVCKRDAEPASGWEATDKYDKEKSRYYAPATQKKEQRPKAKHEYVYYSREGAPLVLITRRDDGLGHKKISQAHWNGVNWVSGLGEDDATRQRVKSSVPIYRYQQVREAIASGKPIFLVEGEGVADALWKLGIAATTTIGGALKYRAYGDYLKDLQGATLVLCPDRDKPGLLHMEDVNKDYPDAKWLYSPPSDFFWSHLPKSGGCDVKDWIESGATSDDILAAIEDRRVVIDHLDKSLVGEDAEKPRATRSTHEQNYNLIRLHWGDRLRWNETRKQVELDGERLPVDGIKTRVALDMHVDMSREDAGEIVVFLARLNSYSPIRDYLNSLPDGDIGLLDGLAAKYLGTSSLLHAAQLKRTLIASVARALNPGCKHDTVCILKGAQGALKSTFWSVLAGEYFSDDLLSGTEKDEILKLSQYWLIEYGEFESAYRKKEVSLLKAFLSRRIDSVRRPYGRDIEDVPRPSIFVGSTNRDDFLNDPTGERRFWVIPVAGKINIAQLKRDRDAIWAAAVTAYRNGEQWWLTDEEEHLLGLENEKYQQQDSWEPLLESYLVGKNEISISTLLSDCLGIEIGRHDRASQMRVTECLKRLDWQKGDRRSSGGKRNQFWMRSKNGQKPPSEVWQQPVPALKASPVSNTPDFTSCHTSEGMAEVWQEVWQDSNLDAVSSSEVAAIPAIPFSQKTFPEKNDDEKISTTPNDSQESLELRGMAVPLEMPQTAEQQGIQPCHTSLPYLEDEVDVQTEDIEAVTDILSACEDIDMLRDVRGFIPAEKLQRAAKLLDSEKREIIRGWVKQINAEVEPGSPATETVPSTVARNYPNWIREGQKVRFCHECHSSFPLVGLIDSVETQIINGEEVFWGASISYWKPYKNRAGEIYDAQQFQYRIDRCDWILKPLSGGLQKPRIETSDRTLEVATVVQPKETQEPQFFEPAEESPTATELPAEKTEMLPIGTPVIHNGGKDGEYHARFGQVGVVVEWLWSDYAVRFSSDDKVIRSGVEELDIEF